MVGDWVEDVGVLEMVWSEEHVTGPYVFGQK